MYILCKVLLKSIPSNSFSDKIPNHKLHQVPKPVEAAIPYSPSRDGEEAAAPNPAELFANVTVEVVGKSDRVVITINHYLIEYF